MALVYVAGPLFTVAERELLEEIARLLESRHHRTYLPHRDAGVFNRATANSRNVFEKDTVVIERCELLVACLNGSDVDSGTAWEIGYAFARGIAMIGYADDSRLFDPPRQINPMIFNALRRIARSSEELATELGLMGY